MQKININFDATKLDKTLMEQGKYVKLDVIELKEQRPQTKKDGTPIEGDTWKLVQTHFVVQSNPNKEIKMPIIGNGSMFIDKKETVAYPVEDINPDNIPF